MIGAREGSIAAVLMDIVGNIQRLIRAEIRLAKAEAREQIGVAAGAVALLAAGGVVLFLTLGLLSLAAVYWLATLVPSWAAALIVAGADAVIGGVLIAVGLKLMRKVSRGLPKTVASVEESVQWAKTAVK